MSPDAFAALTRAVDGVLTRYLHAAPIPETAPSDLKRVLARTNRPDLSALGWAGARKVLVDSLTHDPGDHALESLWRLAGEQALKSFVRERWKTVPIPAQPR